MLHWDVADGPAPVPVAPTVIEQRLKARGLDAPPAYAAFAAEHGGERFESGQNYLRDEKGAVVGLGTLFHYAGNQPLYSVADKWAEAEGELPETLVPIATTNFNGLVCLDYRQDPARPAVVSYDFDARPGQETVRLADSFDALLERVGPR